MKLKTHLKAGTGGHDSKCGCPGSTNTNNNTNTATGVDIGGDVNVGL
jgi:hypothetical protein